MRLRCELSYDLRRCYNASKRSTTGRSEPRKTRGAAIEVREVKSNQETIVHPCSASLFNNIVWHRNLSQRLLCKGLTEWMTDHAMKSPDPLSGTTLHYHEREMRLDGIVG